MKAKTKRRIKHILTKKKLVSKKTSRHFFRTFVILLATVCTGSLAYAITITKPVVSVSVGSTAPNGRVLSGPPTPTPTPIGAVAQSGRGSWYALGLPAPDSLTCASRTFPRGTYLRVKDLYNGHSVVCLVNDYGPEIWTGRVIDLSRGSFREVDDLGRGTIPVEISVASGASGFNLPIRDDIAAIIGYNLCNQGHSAQYCDAHRQD
ncbi:MAG TPA: septal ring lytic transglycosylase RlpA family protein [Candidatus Saccharimonadia bacterium]|nr:septal ring lytic transglycosylase RlpA family protein [Candidatus Saccharimonadia bacterium]